MIDETLRHRKLAAVVAAVLLALPLGCVWAPKTGREDPLDLDKYPQIAVLEGLHRRVMISDVKVENGPPLGVTVVARNRTNDDERHIQYRYFWLDASDSPQDENPDWHYVHMPARTYVYLSGNALDAKYTHWRLELRPAR
jgi:hypothetical protein